MSELGFRINLTPHIPYIESLVRLARSNSGAFRRRVTCFIYLGYAFIVFIFLLAFLLLAGLVVGVFLLFGNIRGFLIIRALMIIIPAVFALFIFVLSLFVNLLRIGFRLLWFRVSPPGGMRLALGMAPLLFRTVEELRAKIGAVPVHDIVLTADFNAGVIQVPRLGLFGAYRNLLYIGLPILQATSPEQFRAILAHELGHVSGSHGRFMLWVESTWHAWLEVLGSLYEQEDDRGYRLLLAFLRWYAPRLAAYEVAMKRTHEYEADRIAKRVAGAEATAGALLATAMKEQYLAEAYVPVMMAKVKNTPREPALLFTGMQAFLAQGIPPETAAKWLSTLLAEDSSIIEPHPPLKERLSLLGFKPELPQGDSMRGIPALPLPTPLSKTAAKEFLGATAGEAAAALDRLVHQSHTSA